MPGSGRYLKTQETQQNDSFLNAWRDSNGGMDSGDIRVYISEGKAKVECASCHDPHGVPTAGRDSQFFPTFLRMSNEKSSLCLTCHTV